MANEAGVNASRWLTHGSVVYGLHGHSDVRQGELNIRKRRRILPTALLIGLTYHTPGPYLANT